MANPRATISFDEIDAHYTTFKIDGSTITYDPTKLGGSVSVGLAVTLSAASTVALAADGDRVIGKLTKVEADGFCSVQDGGYTQLPGGAAAALTLATAIVGALGAAAARGYIRAAASGTAAELVKCNHAIIDPTTPSATVVLLG